MQIAVLRFSAILFGSILLAGCSSWSTDRRLDALEGQAQSQQVIDLRLSHVEDRLTAVEQDVGKLRTPTYTLDKKGRKVETHPVASAPVALGTPIAIATPASSYEPAASLSPTVPKSGTPVGTSTPVSPVPQGPTKIAPPIPVHNQGQPVQSVPMADSGSASTSGSDLSAGMQPGTGVQLSAVDASLAEMRSGASGKKGVGPRRVEPTPAAPDNRTASGSAASSRKTEAVSSARSTLGAQAAYDAALKLYDKGNFAQAQEQFRAFLQEHGENSLAPNALYWIGECYYSRGQFDTAIVTFKDVVGKYPKHAKAAAALLKAGYAYAQLKDKANARFYWQMLVDDFPGSPPARIAQQRLAEK